MRNAGYEHGGRPSPSCAWTWRDKRSNPQFGKVTSRKNNGHTPDAISLSRTQALRTILRHADGLQNISFVIENNHSEAIVDCPTGAGGVNDESLAVALEDLRTFADGHRILFPSLRWRVVNSVRFSRVQGFDIGAM